jgi:hypothetical protein
MDGAEYLALAAAARPPERLRLWYDATLCSGASCVRGMSLPSARSIVTTRLRRRERERRRDAASAAATLTRAVGVARPTDTPEDQRVWRVCKSIERLIRRKSAAYGLVGLYPPRAPDTPVSVCNIQPRHGPALRWLGSTCSARGGVQQGSNQPGSSSTEESAEAASRKRSAEVAATAHAPSGRRW